MTDSTAFLLAALVLSLSTAAQVAFDLYRYIRGRRSQKTQLPSSDASALMSPTMAETLRAYAEARELLLSLKADVEACLALYKQQPENEQEKQDN